jgi:uncharacterized repeat protein (TIGR01451 family)
MLLLRAAAALAFLTILAGPVHAGVVTADLSVMKTDSPDPVTAGGNVTYTITVQNLGPQSASNVSLTDAVPPNTNFVSAAAPAGWTTTTPPVGGTGTITATRAVLTVADGAQVFTVVVQVNPGTPEGTSWANLATVSATEIDPTPANNVASVFTTVLVTSSPSLQPTAAASLLNAAMGDLDSNSQFVFPAFAALLVGSLGLLALANARSWRPPLR